MEEELATQRSISIDISRLVKNIGNERKLFCDARSSFTQSSQPEGPSHGLELPSRKAEHRRKTKHTGSVVQCSGIDGARTIGEISPHAVHWSGDGMGSAVHGGRQIDRGVSKGREGLGRAFSNAVAVSAFAKVIGDGQWRKDRERRR